MQRGAGADGFANRPKLPHEIIDRSCFNRNSERDGFDFTEALASVPLNLTLTAA
jgi:hypothetical protein